MELTDFKTLRKGLTANISPAADGVLATVVSSLRTALASSPMFAGVEVDTTDEAESLVIGMVRYLPGAAPAAVAKHIEEIWLTELRFAGWDAAALIIDKGHVEFEAATMDSEASHFVTLHLIALEGVAADFEAPNNVPAEWAAATATPASARPGRLRRLLSA